MINNVTDFQKCANCGACLNACPLHAININENGMFYHVNVDETICVHCGKCKQVCPVNNPIQIQKTIAAFGVYNNDDNIVINSSSGGMFYTLAEYITSIGGVVFAAVFSEDCKSVVIANTDTVDISALMRSKYVESNVENSFTLIKQELNSNRIVLFCGSPCQAAGLKRYLGKDYDNLYICDFSCGGFPSHELYKKHIEELEKKYKSSVVSVNFRRKVNGWSTRHRLNVSFSNGKEYLQPADFDNYMYNFLKHNSIRDYCCDCDFADNHYSDIILADFWLYRKISNIPPNRKGLSLVIINSEKGKSLFEKTREKLTVYDIDLEAASYNLKRRKYNDETMDRRKKFIENYKTKGLSKATLIAGMPSGIPLLYWKIRYKVSEYWRNRT